MKEITFNWNSGETTAKSLADLINIVLTEYICDDVIADRFLEIHATAKEIVVYFPTFMLDENSINEDFKFIVNQDCIMFSIENITDSTLKLLNHISDLLEQDDEITITESKETI